MVKVFNTPEPIIDCCFHPTEPLIISSLINGGLVIHRYENDVLDETTATTMSEKDDLLGSKAVIEKETNNGIITKGQFQPHSESCRGFAFSSDGTTIVSISADKSIAWTSLDNGQVTRRLVGGHKVGINRVLRLNDHLITTGDEEGTVKLWDERCLDFEATSSSINSTSARNSLKRNKVTGMKQQQQRRRRQYIAKFNEHVDYISSFAHNDSSKTLISSSGDGRVVIYDVRQMRIRASSESLEEEILCIHLLKGNKRLVAGMGDGTVHIFHWDEWLNPVDGYTGLSSPVDSIEVLDDEKGTFLTGTSDGYIRALQCQPSQFLGIMVNTNAFHEKIQYQKVEKSPSSVSSALELPVVFMSLSRDKRYLLAGTHDDYGLMLKGETIFSELETLLTNKESSNPELATTKKTKKRSTKTLPLTTRQSLNAQFFADL